jgi:hypothetical protein
VCGGHTKGESPFGEEFGAFFEPRLREFWLSEDKDTLEAGAKVFPLTVFFAPRDARPIETLLVVDLGASERTVKVCGSTSGFQGRRWGERRHYT